MYIEMYMNMPLNLQSTLELTFPPLSTTVGHTYHVIQEATITDDSVC